jgi:hypothetical protein
MIVAGAFLTAGASATAAQQPSGRIDLELFAGVPTQLVSVRAAFVESTAVCPEDRALLTISDGILRQLRSNPPPRRQTFLRLQSKTIDDETYLHQYSTNDCRIDLLVRMQVLRDGSWTSLLLPKRRRPSRSAVDPKTAADELMAEARARSERLSPEERKEREDRFREQQTTGWSVGRVGTMSIGFAFEEAPRDCFEAVGDYFLNGSGITFSFPTNLPGVLNHFVIERSDIDDDHARLYFIKGECRFEIVLAGSVLSDGQWVSRSIAPPPHRAQR